MFDRLLPEKLLPEKHALHLILGDVDTGKSTLCRQLVRRGLEQGWTIGVVDADIGQSWIGPPSTIGMRCFAQDDSASPADAIYFVGAISPVGHLPEMISGVRQLVDRCWAMQADSVLVDTTGYVVGDTALRLKRRKIEALMPDHIVLLQRSNEAEPLLRWLRATAAASLHVLRPDPAVRRKSHVARKAYREKQLESYFHNACVADFDLARIPILEAGWGDGRPASEAELQTLGELLGTSIQYAEWRPGSVAIAVEGMVAEETWRAFSSRLGRNVYRLSEEPYRHRLVGLCGACGKGLGLGWILSIDWAARRIHVLSPVEAEQVCAIKIGSYRWSRSLQKEST